MCFNLCGAASSLVLGRLHGGGRRKLWVALTYTGMALALAVLPLTARHFALALAACAVAGIFIIGAQLVLFALAPLYYRRVMRGTGVGSAVAIGRLGSVLGPLYAGLLLSAGGGSATVSAWHRAGGGGRRCLGAGPDVSAALYRISAARMALRCARPGRSHRRAPKGR